MPILSSSDIQDLADLASDLALIEDCTIERASVGNGQVDRTNIETVKALATIPKQPIQGRLGMIEDYSGNLMYWNVLLPLNTNVSEGDVLIIQGQRMTVQKVLTPESYSVFDQVEASGVHG